MAKSILFSELPISATRDGDTVVAYRNGRVIRIPIPSAGTDPSGLAAVATSGKYSDLSGLPTLGSAASKNEAYFATADQGGKGVSAYLWGNHASAGYALASSVTQALAQKVDAVAGKELSTNDFTSEYKEAVEGLGTAALKDVAAFATADQGNKGATAHSWGNHSAAGYALETAVTTQLSGKVDKQTGYGLSQNNFTAAEKAKLAGLEGSHYQGLFTSVNDLPALAISGDYADVDAGAGDDVTRYIWDNSDNEWVQQAGKASPLTASEIKTLYEQNPDTNTFSDAEKGKLSGIAANATANSTNAYLLNRANHTGTQDVSTITGLGNAATANFGTAASGVARGNHTHANYWDISNRTGYAPTGNLDDFTAGQGGYVRLPTNENAPSTGLDVITKAQYGADDLLQIAFPQRTAEELYMRTRAASGWRDWIRFWHDGNFNPSSYYTKADVDNLITSASGGGRIYQAATGALTVNKDHKVSFTVNRTLTLPANPAENDYVSVVASAGSMRGSTIARNGKTIMGLAENMTVDAKVYYLRLDYVAGSWRITS